jgi:hypothetical protein
VEALEQVVKGQTAGHPHLLALQLLPLAEEVVVQAPQGQLQTARPAMETVETVLHQASQDHL